MHVLSVFRHKLDFRSAPAKKHRNQNAVLCLHRYFGYTHCGLGAFVGIKKYPPAPFRSSVGYRLANARSKIYTGSQNERVLFSNHKKPRCSQNILLRDMNNF